jgi:hypothetical protein
MENILKALGCLCLILLMSVTSHAKGWRGIIPFHSTRADVEKLLGEEPPPPKDGKVFYTPNNGRSIYFLDEGEILIVYANDAVPAAVDCLGKIPVDTVLIIQVRPKKEVSLSDLGIEEKRFRKFDPSEPAGIGFAGYIDEEEGLAIRTREGKVEQINYVAAKRDRHLCPSYNPTPEDSITITVDFFDRRPAP